MKRALLTSLLALVAVAVAAAPSLGAPGGVPATAEISVVFSADFESAQITSSKGVSHYDIVLCDGTTFRRELSGDDKVVTVGPYGVQIVSIAVKSATTKLTFNSGFSGDCKKDPPPPPDPK